MCASECEFHLVALLNAFECAPRTLEEEISYSTKFKNIKSTTTNEFLQQLSIKFPVWNSKFPLSYLNIVNLDEKDILFNVKSVTKCISITLPTPSVSGTFPYVHFIVH